MASLPCHEDVIAWVSSDHPVRGHLGDEARLEQSQVSTARDGAASV